MLGAPPEEQFKCAQALAKTLFGPSVQNKFVEEMYVAGVRFPFNNLSSESTGIPQTLVYQGRLDSKGLHTVYENQPRKSLELTQTHFKFCSIRLDAERAWGEERPLVDDPVAIIVEDVPELESDSESEDEPEGCMGNHKHGTRCDICKEMDYEEYDALYFGRKVQRYENNCVANLPGITTMAKRRRTI